MRPVCGRPGIVAQICNLPYRRFVIGWALKTCGCVEPARAPQNAILRYGRLQICATRLAPVRECLCATEHLGRARKPLAGFFLAAGLALSLPAAERFASDSTNGWQGVAARAEIKPQFSFNARGGPNHHGALVIRADNREGWTVTGRGRFP